MSAVRKLISEIQEILDRPIKPNKRDRLIKALLQRKLERINTGKNVDLPVEKCDDDNIG